MLESYEVYFEVHTDPSAPYSELFSAMPTMSLNAAQGFLKGDLVLRADHFDGDLQGLAQHKKEYRLRYRKVGA